MGSWEAGSMGAGEAYAWGWRGQRPACDHLLCLPWLHATHPTFITSWGREALVPEVQGKTRRTLSLSWAVGGRARSCVCGDSAAGHGWLAPGPSHILALE